MSKTQTVFRLTLPSNPKHINKVEVLLKKIQKNIRLDEIQFHKMMVSLTEAVNNAMIHGNKCDVHKKVTVKCEALPGWLVSIVTDEGKGFKPEEVRNPLDEENLLRTSGRGIFLMRTLMDKVEYEFGKRGSQLVLWLDLKK